MRRRDVIKLSFAGMGYFCAGCGRQPAQKKSEANGSVSPPPPPPPPPPLLWSKLVFPTQQQGLLEEGREDVFQPTAAGTRESALYGSVRTVNRGGRLLASFHEGIDIAPVRRDRRGRPLDDVLAVAEGKVAYVNKVAGNSTYGKYAVVEHDDPMGPVYTLYAHLASVAVKRGDAVTPGHALGRMGNTATYTIPMSRAHLHFEVGVMLNSRFERWYDGKKLTPSHGLCHGWNILGVNPLDFFKLQRLNSLMKFDDALDAAAVAFELVIKTGKMPDYFRRYPSRWSGAAFPGGHMTVAFSENGVPLRGRAAAEDEAGLIKKGLAAVVSADKEVLGRNGARLVAERSSGWALAASGERRVELLLY
ncbi:MAG: M23 family metallopeptidase [Kiritimatiellae bacterium]|nr:M23 family metallopeptidase [Kiritimatiellia bacterium]